MTIEQAIGCALIGMFFAWVGERSWHYYIIGAVVFVILGFGLSYSQSMIDRSKADFLAKHVTMTELKAFACGVLRERGEVALTDGCDKFKDLQP